MDLTVLFQGFWLDQPSWAHRVSVGLLLVGPLTLCVPETSLARADVLAGEDEQETGLLVNYKVQ